MTAFPKIGDGKKGDRRPARIRRRRSTGFDRRYVRGLFDNGLGVQEAGRKLLVIAGRAHCDRDAARRTAIGRRVAEPNLEWFLYGYAIVQRLGDAGTHLRNLDRVTTG